MMNKKLSSTKTPPNALLKFAIDLGPLVIFFFANARWGIITATAIFMVAIVVSFFLAYFLERRIPFLPLVTAILVLVFGGLTIALNDALFIKLKPTIINSLFAVALFSGIAFKRIFLKILFGNAFKLTDEGWRILTFRWGYFFIFLAVLNEIVWRTVSTDMWVNFKVFGIIPLTLIFSFAQLKILNRYRSED